MTEQKQYVVKGQPVSEEEILKNGDEPTGPIDPPKISGSSWGIFGTLFRLYRAHKKEKKLADKGYVKWYLVGSSWPEPKFIKPEAKGGGIPEYKYDGQTYLFPRKAALASRTSGMWTVIHKRNESDPLNLSDPTENAIKADELSEYLTKRVTSSPPSFFDKLDLDADDLIKYAVAGIILLAIAQQFMGGF